MDTETINTTLRRLTKNLTLTPKHIMTPSPRKPHRYGGLQVRICGHVIQEGAQGTSIVCQLHPDEKHSSHAAIALGSKTIYAFLKLSDGDVQVWQLTEE